VGDEQQLVADLERLVGVGVITRSPRRTAVSTVSRGSGTSRSGLPAQGVSSSRVISTRLAAPLRKLISRTTSPTVTASSTSAASTRGVDTATSTPQASV
jgi:hypothetical protein